MPCYQSTNLPSGVTTTGRTSYTTEADCLNACKEGACCEGTTCTVKPACQCQGDDKKFQGVGTVCAADTCQFCTPQGYPKSFNLGVGGCYCYCTVNGGKVPRFVNVTFSYTYETNYTGCNVSNQQTVTLTRRQQSIYTDASSFSGVVQCYSYFFKNSDFELNVSTALNPGEALTLQFKVYGPACLPFAPPLNQITVTGGREYFLSRLMADGGLGTGVCFSRFAGSTSSGGQAISAQGISPNLSGTFSYTLTINGFQ
jgi:hypothetical protein